MQWLIHGTLTPAVADALKRHGHTVHSISELALGEKPAAIDLFKAIHPRQWDLITNDQPLSQFLFQTPTPYGRSIVFLQLEGGDVEQDDAIDRLFQRYKRLTPGRLYTVTASRVKIRQLPTIANRQSAVGYQQSQED